VLVLSGIQIYAYSTVTLFLILLWAHPESDFVFHTHRRFFNEAFTYPRDHPAFILAVLDLVFVVSGCWLMLFWHAVIAMALCAVIVHQVRPEYLRSLPAPMSTPTTRRAEPHAAQRSVPRAPR
jgi:hypothetical protein